MKRLVAIVTLSLALMGCAALQRVTPFLPTPTQLACLELSADKGMPAIQIITSCGFAADALAFVESFLIGHRKAKAIRMGLASEETTVIILVKPLDAGAEGGAK